MRNPLAKPGFSPRLLRRGAGIVTVAALVAGSGAFAGPALAADTTPPAAPTDLEISPATTRDGSVVLTWDAPNARDISYYQIFRVPDHLDEAADEVTYVGRTEDETTEFEDELPTEGTFHYAVMAVDTANNASEASDWDSVRVDFPDNGTGTISPDRTEPEKPTGVEADEAFTQHRTVDIMWDASEASDIWRYLVYRADQNNSRKLVAYVDADYATVLSDTVPAENSYTYYVLAQDSTGNVSSLSAGVGVVVDNTDPAVKINAPVNGRTYKGTGDLTISTAITETGAGYESDAVAYDLDGEELDSRTIDLEDLDEGAHTLRVTVTDRAGNTGSAQSRFIVGDEVDEDLAPRNLTVDEYSKDRTVDLEWSEPRDGNVSRYVVFRIDPDGDEEEVETLRASETSYTDTVPADGEYSYYVVAEHRSDDDEASEVVTTVVDTKAPQITISSPAADKSYQQTGKLSIKASVKDETAGYDDDDVAYYLDGESFDEGSIDLADLAIGSHIFKVEAEDLAGNSAAKSISFKVVAVTDDDDDEDDDDDDDNDGQYDTLLQVLASQQAKIHHGHYAALLAKVRAGNIRGFIAHVVKFRGKFIAPDAADKLLEAALGLSGQGDADDDEQWDEDFDDDEWRDGWNDGGWKKPGKGKGPKW